MAGQLLRSPTLPPCTCPQLAARQPAQHRQPCTARLSAWPSHSVSSSSACSSARRSHTLRVAALEEAPAETSAAERTGSDAHSLSAEGVFADVSSFGVCRRSDDVHAEACVQIRHYSYQITCQHSCTHLHRVPDPSQRRPGRTVRCAVVSRNVLVTNQSGVLLLPSCSALAPYIDSCRTAWLSGKHAVTLPCC